MSVSFLLLFQNSVHNVSPFPYNAVQHTRYIYGCYFYRPVYGKVQINAFLPFSSVIGNNKCSSYLFGVVERGYFLCFQACIIYSRASGRTERMIVIAAMATLHLLFLLYLHFAYHTIVEGNWSHF